jgi:RNA polymerase sigma-70 factor (ECF subfamily)
LDPKVLRNEPTLADSDADSIFDSVYEQHFTFVWRCLRSLGVPAAGLDDAAQDVFLVVHRRLATFEGLSSFRTWLFGIVRHVAFNHRRTRERKGGLDAPTRDLPSAEPGPHESAEAAEVTAFVERFLDGLDDKKREVFALAVLEELSIPEVAEALGIPLNTAYTRLRRAREEFRKALAERQLIA